MVSQKPKYCKNFERNSHWRNLSMIMVWERYCNASPKPEFFLFSLFIFSFIFQLIWVRLGWNFQRWFSIQKQVNWCTTDPFSFKFCTSQHSYPVPLKETENEKYSVLVQKSSFAAYIQNGSRMKFNQFVFVLNKILSGNKWKETKYIVRSRPNNRGIRIAGSQITKVRLYSEMVFCNQNVCKHSLCVSGHWNGESMKKKGVIRGHTRPQPFHILVCPMSLWLLDSNGKRLTSWLHDLPEKVHILMTLQGVENLLTFCAD